MGRLAYYLSFSGFDWGNIMSSIYFSIGIWYLIFTVYVACKISKVCELLRDQKYEKIINNLKKEIKEFKEEITKLKIK